MKTLRDYQLKGIQEIYVAWAREQRALLVMPTGSGKSFTCFSLVKQCYEVYPVVIAVRTRNLVQQLEASAIEMGLPHGVIMRGMHTNPGAPIQICSIDTLRSRNSYPFCSKKKVILVIDEADESKSEGFQNFINRYKSPLIVGMTATPYNGLSHFDVVVSPITAKELNERGILVDYDYVIPEIRIDLSEVPIEKGEFKQKELGKTSIKSAVRGDTYKAWLEFSEHRPTLIFNSNVEQSRETVKIFNREMYAGAAVHCDAKMPEAKRIQAIKDFREGRIKILSVVGLFKRGTDIPEIGCIIDQAGTLRINNHIQKLGRGSRKNLHFKNCIIIDMAANCLTLNHFYFERPIDLSKAIKFTAKDIGQALMRCKKCFRPAGPSDFKLGRCPYCGHMNREIKRTMQIKAAKLKSVTPEAIEQKNIINEFKKQLWQHQNLGGFARKFYKYPKGPARNAEIRLYLHKRLFKKYGAEKLRSVAGALGLKHSLIYEFIREG